MSSKVVLLVNLGSPDSPDVGDVRRYLKEFLMDPLVMDMSFLTRYFLVNGVVIPNRVKSSAEAYKSIWTDVGSPLVVYTQKLKDAIASQIDFPVFMAMRYGNPSIKNVIKIIQKSLGDMVDEIFLLPLYPHFAASSYQTAVDEVQKQVSLILPKVSLQIHPPFYQDKSYINDLSNSIQPYLSEKSHLLFSYHGLPARHIKNADSTGRHCLNRHDCCDISSDAHATCYRHQVFETTKGVVKQLDLAENRYSVGFQSRLGRDPWLDPNTELVISDLGKQGVQDLVVVCPSFVADCLETLEEIGVRGEALFHQAGGQKFSLVPCLNDSPDWVKTVVSYVGTENG